MSLERLLGKIEDDGRLEGTRIVAEAKEEAERIREKGLEETRLAVESIRNTFREKGERERTRIMSEALAESRATFLSSQDDLFEEAFTEALNDFEDLPEDRYRVWLKRVIMENVSGGKEKVIAAPYDRRLLDEGLLEEINVEIEERGGKGSLSLARESAEFSRGVILKSRNFVNNLSLETLMREVRDRHEEDVLKMLFGEVDVRGASR
jgi:V/A-type H+-transporting ATPase subunit E